MLTGVGSHREWNRLLEKGGKGAVFAADSPAEQSGNTPRPQIAKPQTKF